MIHHVITRMAFKPDDPQWPWRLAFYRSMVLPRFLRQTDQEFDIWVRCYPVHNEIVDSLHPKVHPYQGYGIEDEIMGIDKTCQNHIPRSHIQTRVDSDDLVSDDFISRIHAEVAFHPDKPLIVSFQPWKLDLYTLTRYRMGQRYHEKSNSMFLSLYQPDINGENYRNIYDFKHGHLAQELGESARVATIPEGYCDMVIHDKNMGTSILKGDTALEVMN